MKYKTIGRIPESLYNRLKSNKKIDQEPFYSVIKRLMDFYDKEFAESKVENRG